MLARVSLFPRAALGALVLLLVLVALPAGAAAAAQAESTPAVTSHRAPSHVRFGAYVDGMQQDPAALTEFEDLVGAETKIASYYYGFGDVFPGETELAFADSGRRKVLLSWDMGRTRFRQWAAGRYDGYLDSIAAAARDYPYALYVRPWPEMNGDWQSFQPTRWGKKRRGGTYSQFIAAWRHVVSYTRHQGAHNIRWVFNPSSDTYAETTPVARIWPGSRFVDVLGIDGFNWGVDDGWGRWLSYSSIFAVQYDRLTALDERAPVWICEFGSKEPSVDDGAPVDTAHSKGSWLRRAFSSSTMPRVRAMVYFDARKERDWRVSSSPGALGALRKVLASW